jgi:pimeloyl-ACP methyl ester carboxylesterase
VLAAVLVGGAGLVGTAGAEPAQHLVWAPCQENAEVECATITVPIDWQRPATGTTEVAVARRHATDPADRKGTLVFMPGGPGGSGVDAILDPDRVPAAVAAKYDVVSYDPRGTNRSDAVRCDAELVANIPNVIPDTGAQLADVKAYSRKLGASCRAASGPLVDHLDNVSVAKDIDAIRAALGERKLTLYGRSYGTLAGQMYAENFPHRVRGLVLDSVFDHSLSTTRFLVTEARTGEDAFTEFATWCAATTDCALHGRDVQQVYGDLYDKAARGALTDPSSGRPVAPMDLVGRTINPLYGPSWGALADQLAALADQLPTAATRSSADTVPFPIIAYCTDHRVRISSQREWEGMWREQKEAAPTLRTHFAWQAVSMCADLGVATPNPQHRTDLDDDVPPVLIMNSLHDPATGYEWARSVHRQLDDSVLLTYDGWGHGVTDRTDCTQAVFTTYVLDGRTPRPGTHCAAATEGEK